MKYFRRIVVFITVIVIAVLFLRFVFGIRPFGISSSSMTPALQPGDWILVEGPEKRLRRGEIIIFKTDAISSLVPGEFFIQRVVGLPGDQLQILDGKLYVNGKHEDFRNVSGSIYYKSWFSLASSNIVTVPPGSYFVLGDNSEISRDSRVWGFVPASSVLGSVWFCYWPPRHFGEVK